MKQNTYLSILKGVALSLSFTFLASCNDFLDITPPSTVSPEMYLVEESQLAAYTIRYYQENFPRLNDQYGGDVVTDNATTKAVNNRYVPGEWKTPEKDGDWDFKRIYEMNYYLETVVPRLEANEIKGDPVKIKHYVGEGYYLRAYQYFFRLKKLGDFPIITRTFSDDEVEALVETSQRQPRNEVARFILSDLDKAIALLTNNPDGGKARITLNAALVLKARVALFEATWLKYHAGTPLVPNGPNWPGKDKAYNANYQFPSGSLQGEINFFLDEAMKASEIVADAIQLETNSKVIQESLGDPANDYYNMFATQDPQKYAEVIFFRPYSTALNLGTDYNHHIYHGYARGYTRQMEQVFLMQNGLPVYANGSGYAGDDFIGDTKVDRDWRWRLFMKAPGEVKAFINTSTIERFSDAPMVYSNDVKYSTSTGYLIGKAYSHDYNNQILNKDETASIMVRAVEAYLTYLEAYYEKNGRVDGKAGLYWKAIRARAGVDTDYSKTIAATDMAKESANDWGAYSHGQLIDATLYNIRRERRCEFIGEGFRYDDVIRWRAMDQLNGYQLEGCKLFGPMLANYDQSKLVYDKSDKENTVSSPTKSIYVRPFQVASNSLLYDGIKFIEPHYLTPIAEKHFLITSQNGDNPETSPIYQNPGWSIKANEAPKLP
ncbi:RagB/SusD family nutrient uptake outer membrane protein [Bacteroides sp. 51]|uniref:RagB/SusD family nutrient uptake outer membrane protein n=1 Tax=Bacteroides sp. 51 TaxID=2302938 RepID=UPI0013D2D263|nr:RagB/SusD family nutrient uptake outer membrane protein [Bacteroides sp. 51]NDV83114.1 RagB/SusD family nutrient uptake outer membrane protein [Bacteroides sp. 51]